MGSVGVVRTMADACVWEECADQHTVERNMEDGVIVTLECTWNQSINQIIHPSNSSNLVPQNPHSSSDKKVLFISHTSLIILLLLSPSSILKYPSSLSLSLPQIFLFSLISPPPSSPRAAPPGTRGSTRTAPRGGAHTVGTMRTHPVCK